jgi:hypothetical protein
MGHEVVPGETCEVCGAPATNIFIRATSIERDTAGRPVAKHDPRAPLCDRCAQGVRMHRVQLAKGNVIHRF